jgi:hypothetical protein
LSNPVGLPGSRGTIKKRILIPKRAKHRSKELREMIPPYFGETSFLSVLIIMIQDHTVIELMICKNLYFNQKRKNKCVYGKMISNNAFTTTKK